MYTNTRGLDSQAELTDRPKKDPARCRRFAFAQKSDSNRDSREAPNERERPCEVTGVLVGFNVLATTDGYSSNREIEADG